MDMIVTQRPNRFRRIMWFAVGAAILLVAGGTVLALNDNLNPSGWLQSAESFIKGGSKFSVKVDHSALPADGMAQTRITVVTTRTVDVRARILSGGGEVVAHPQDNNVFVYTAGTESGIARVIIEGGSYSETISLTLIPATAPKQITVVAPPDGSTTNNPRPEVAGTAPANARLIITTNGTENTTTRADDQGVFKTILEKPLYNGQHTISVSVVNELNSPSQTSNLVTITVQADPVKVDANNIRTSPARLTTNNSFGLFIPASLNTSRVVVELLDRTYELYSPHGSTVFSGVLPTPADAGVYFGNLVLYDTGGNPTRFDKLLRFTVASS